MKGDLKKAAKLYRGRKYTKLIRLLEPQIFRFRQSYDFYFLIGMACLHTGDLGGASTYLQRALGLKPQDVDAQLGLAIVHLHRQEVQEAIRCYLEILDDNPKNRQAQRGLDFIKKGTFADQDLSRSGKVRRLLPGHKLNPAPVIIVLLALSVAVPSAYWGYLQIKDRPVREPSVSQMSLSDIGDIVDLTGDYRYVLTENQIEDLFTSIKRNFSDFKDNVARREINRLLGSNASQPVKEQARTILQYLSEPDFTSIQDPFPYEEVVEDPYLHQGTFVVWSGKISNMQIGDDQIAFDLLVGYENNEVLLGVVNVVLTFGALLNQGDAVEILGQIQLNEDGEAFLRAVSIHKLNPEGSR